MDAVKATLIGTGVAAFGIVSAFVGGLINQRMSRSAQHEQWLLDNRKGEFRELVSALTTTVVTTIAYSEIRLKNPTRAMELLNQLRENQHRVYNVIADRIYIAQDVEDLNVFNRYMDILNDLRQSTNENGAAERMDALITEIVGVARKG